MLCQMSKYFGKCFDPSSRAPKSLTLMPQLFIIKICFTIKVNSICRAGYLESASQVKSQGPAVRILCCRVAIPKSQGPISRVLGVRVPCSRVPVPGSWVSGSRVLGSRSPSVSGPKVPGFRVLGLRVPGSWVLDPRIPGLGSQVLILVYAHSQWFYALLNFRSFISVFIDLISSIVISRLPLIR